MVENENEKKEKEGEKGKVTQTTHQRQVECVFWFFIALLFHAKVDEEMRGNHSERVQLGKFGETESRVALCDRTFL